LLLLKREHFRKPSFIKDALAYGGLNYIELPVLTFDYIK